TIPLKVVASTRPLARVLNRSYSDGQAGTAKTVEVLADAFDPFGRGLTVIGAVVETPGSGSASFSGSVVTVRPAEDFIGAMVTRFTVQDVTGDPDRHVEARITLQVAAVPLAPGAPRVVEIRDKAVLLAWGAPDGRGLDISGYRVTIRGTNRQVLCPTTSCVVDGLTNGTTYTFTVAARNAVGWSEESPPSAPAAPDAVPDAPQPPTVSAGAGTVNVSWSAPANNGSPITSYDVEISPRPRSPANPATIRVKTTSARFQGLTNGTAYKVRVRAYNDAPQAGPWSAWSDEITPMGAPGAPTQLSTSPLAATQLQLSWRAPDPNGSPLGAYQLVVVGGGTTRTFAPARDVEKFTVDVLNNVEYEFTLTASNAVGSSPPATVTGSTFGRPGAPRVVSVVGQSGGSYNQGTATVTLSPGHDGGSPITSYNVRARTGQTATFTSTSGTLTGLAGGKDAWVEAQACNQRGCGDWSDTPVLAAPQPRTAPGQVGSLRVDISYNGGQPAEAYATWSAPDWAGGSEQGYQVTWLVNGDTVSSTTVTTLNARLTQGLPTLAEARPTAQVSVTVTAVSSVGVGAPARADATARWAAGPAAPAGLRVNGGFPITFAWNAVPGATSYDWRVTRDGEVAASGSTTGLSQSAEVAYNANSRVVVEVRAVTADGKSTWTPGQVN
ncbi:MAG: fibronectin type III domain-containing protein, partial [Micrococcales bacterium]|nr:fibronectin type III domain-containing protein [Micrococcales bacterium]